MLSHLLTSCACVLGLPAVQDAAALAANAARHDPKLSTAGWAFMLISVGGVVIWTALCFRAVLTAPEGSETPPPSGYGP